MNRKFTLYFISCWFCIGGFIISCKKKDSVFKDSVFIDEPAFGEFIDTSTLIRISGYSTIGYYPTYFQIEGNIFAGLGSIGFPPTSGANKKWYKYSIQGNNWQEMREFPGEKRQSRTSFSFKGKGYLIGGTDSYIDPPSGTIRKVFNDFWQYDPQTDEWTEKNVPPLTPLVLDQPATNLYRMSTANHLFIVEGNKLWKYLPENDSWQVVSPTIPFSVKGGSNTFDEVGYAFSADSTLWEYNPTSSQWRSVIKIQESSYFIIKNKLYAVGMDPLNNNDPDWNLRYTHYFWEYDLETKMKRRLQKIPALSVDGPQRPYLNISTSDNESGYFGLDRRSYPNAMYKFTP
jgi:hypothetical protein